MSDEQNGNGDAEKAVETIRECVEAGIKATFTMIRIPLLIYASCLTTVGKVMEDVAEQLRLDNGEE